MSPYRPARPGERLTRAPQWFAGVSCQHPHPIDITALNDGYETCMCNGCGTRYGQRPWTWRW